MLEESGESVGVVEWSPAAVGSFVGSSGSAVALFVASAAVIRRLRRMGVSMEVLTIQSWRAVRLRMRDSSRTSEERAVSPQGDVGRT